MKSNNYNYYLLSDFHNNYLSRCIYYNLCLNSQWDYLCYNYCSNYSEFDLLKSDFSGWGWMGIFRDAMNFFGILYN